MRYVRAGEISAVCVCVCARATLEKHPIEFSVFHFKNPKNPIMITSFIFLILPHSQRSMLM